MASETKAERARIHARSHGERLSPGLEADPPHGADGGAGHYAPPVPTGLLTRVIIPENWAPSRSRETNENL